MTAVLQVTELSYRYDGAAAPALSAFNFSVAPNEIVSIVGPSGCGKTTLLNLIAGLIKPIGGTIAVGSEEQGKLQVGYILQQDALLPWRNIKGNLSLAFEFGRLSREESESRMRSLLEAFHLKLDVLDKFPNQLSGGMRQRASIIQALMFDPMLLLLDEPFSALDFFTKLRLEREFHDLVKMKNKAAVLITHDIEEAIAVSDRIILMAPGGKMTDEIMIDRTQLRTPEEARGVPDFAAYYQRIWSALEANIRQ